jgi:hypothetical protein
MWMGMLEAGAGSGVGRLSSHSARRMVARVVGLGRGAGALRMVMVGERGGGGGGDTSGGAAPWKLARGRTTA